jgi:hypothetical protein
MSWHEVCCQVGDGQDVAELGQEQLVVGTLGAAGGVPALDERSGVRARHVAGMVAAEWSANHGQRTRADREAGVGQRSNL